MSGGTRYTAEDFAKALDPYLRRLAGVARRMAVDLTKITKVSGWKVLGHLLDGGRESFTAEIFSGVGFYSRPPKGAKADAIVINEGGADDPVIVATRDEKTRQASAGSLAEDETAVFNSKVILHLKADGTLEARTVSGAAVALATKADVQAVRDALHNHSHTYIPGSNAATQTTGNPSVPAPTGTQKFRAE